MLSIAFHLDSTKFVQGIDVKPDELASFGAQAVEAFKKQLNDPDIHPSRVGILTVDAAPGAKVVGSTTVAGLAPAAAPTITTHGE